MVNAGEIIKEISSGDISGTLNFGSPAFIVYKSPIVLTGRFPNFTIKVVIIIAIKGPGIFFDTFGHNI